MKKTLDESMGLSLLSDEEVAAQKEATEERLEFIRSRIQSFGTTPSATRKEEEKEVEASGGLERFLGPVPLFERCYNAVVDGRPCDQLRGHDGGHASDEGPSHLRAERSDLSELPLRCGEEIHMTRMRARELYCQTFLATFKKGWTTEQSMDAAKRVYLRALEDWEHE